VDGRDAELTSAFAGFPVVLGGAVTNVHIKSGSFVGESSCILFLHFKSMALKLRRISKEKSMAKKSRSLPLQLSSLK
jgi:hypothetical protein